MMAWLFLCGAILAEVSGTLCLRMGATTDRRRWYGGAVGGYVVAFGLLFGALDRGMALGVAYGIWVAVGVALTALASRVLFKEPLTRLMVAGIALVATGVLLVEIGGH